MQEESNILLRFVCCLLQICESLHRTGLVEALSGTGHANENITGKCWAELIQLMSETLLVAGLGLFLLLEPWSEPLEAKWQTGTWEGRCHMKRLT